MLARAPASPVQGFHQHHGPRYFNFLIFVQSVALRNLDFVQVGQSFKTVGCGCTSCWGDVGAGDAEADVIYTKYIIHRERPTHRVLSTVLTQDTKGQRGQLDQGVQC